MSETFSAKEFDLAAAPVLDAKAWRSGLSARLGDGERAVALFGRRRDREVMITSAIQDAAGSLSVSRCRASVDQGYHSLTADFPALHCFERELHEQTGIRIAGHPWLKPIRYENRSQSSMDDFPFYKIEGKEIHEVAVGPIHAGVIEPGSFRFMCAGEQVLHLEVQLGYQHRGVESLLLSGDPFRLSPLVETIAGDSSIAHCWAYSSAIEKLAGCGVDRSTALVRAMLLEMERIAMHLSGLAGLSLDMGFLQGGSTYGRLRTIIINSTMRLCGNRLGRGAIRPGTVKADLSSEVLESLRSNLRLLQRDLSIINDLFLSSITVKRRLQGTGILAKERALQLGVVGMVARASGVAMDARRSGREGAYSDPEIGSARLGDGDCWARALVRIEESAASVSWLLAILEPGNIEVAPRALIGPLAKGKMAVAIVEGWRGEVIHCIETDEAGKIIHYKVQDPSFRNWLGLAIAVRGNEISDFPICNKSFDLSYCGNDL